jgi:hypothetical protein
MQYTESCHPVPGSARSRRLTSSPPKLEAFKGRGNRDFLGSRDFGDIIALVDGREELVDEVAQAKDVRDYIAAEFADLQADPRFADGLFAALRPDAASQARAEMDVMPRLRALLT